MSTHQRKLNASSFCLRKGNDMKYEVYSTNGFEASFRNIKYAMAEVKELMRKGKRAWIKEVTI